MTSSFSNFCWGGEKTLSGGRKSQCPPPYETLIDHLGCVLTVRYDTPMDNDRLYIHTSNV